MPQNYALNLNQYRKNEFYQYQYWDLLKIFVKK